MNIVLKKEHVLLVIVFVIALFFRFYKLSLTAPSPSLDEVSLGYNAYAILHTGRDEFGNFLPILLRAYDDWRPALYVYLIVPFIKIFGLSILSVRLPSSILSMITLISSYFLAKELFKTNDWEFRIGNLELGIPIIALFLLAISPWHIYISRLGHEVNAGLTSVVLGSLLFIKGIDSKRKWYIYTAAVVFGISFYTYQSEKIFTPLLLVAFVFAFWRQIIQYKKEIILFFVVIFLIAIPMFRQSISMQGLSRLKATSAFSNLDYEYNQSAKQLLKDKTDHNIFGQIIDNRRLVPLRIFTQNYFAHFSPAWLFANGGREAFKAPGLGLFYPWESIFLLLGIVFLVGRNFSLSSKLIVFFSIAASLVAPAITTQAPHAMRAFNMLPMPQIIEAVGILGVINMTGYFLKKTSHIVCVAFVLGFMIIVISLMSIFYRDYFIDFPKLESQQFQYALSQALKYAIKNQNSYSKIVISNQDNAYQSYMFYLFWSKLDPSNYQAAGGTFSGGFAARHTIGKYEFRPIVWQKEKEEGKVLFIGNTTDFPENVNSVYKGYYLDGTQGLELVTKQI